MSNRNFWKIVLFSSFISAGVVFFFLRWSSPPSTQAEFAQSSGTTSGTTFDTPLTEDESINIRIYESRSRGVVNITTTTLEYTWFFEVVPRQGVGSGVVIDKKGHIVTNYHVIRDAERLEVTLYDKETYEAERVGIDPINDIAVLKIDCPEEKLYPVQLGRSDDLKVGQKVLAIGNPFGLDQTLTTGIISSLQRTLRTDFGLIEDVIQTDAAINPGNSGGPLLNRRGEVIGINTAIFSRTGESVGIGFAVPVDTVSRILPDLLEHGRVLRAWFGIQGQPLSPRLAQALRLPVEEGLLVVQVESRSSADQAGIRGGQRRVFFGNLPLLIGGDVIVALGGQSVTSMEDLASILEDKRPGDRISVVYYRGQKKIEKEMQLEGTQGQGRFRF
ncbi:MAG: trypsin-like peptidase domain-containing protein [Acidobacteria bacterium]|nr:trypsin-like peptidase domain-containing protein [Acidobacteriota bacterium]